MISKHVTTVQKSNFINFLKYLIPLVLVFFISACNNSAIPESKNESNSSNEEAKSLFESNGSTQKNSAQQSDADLETGNAELSEQRAREQEYAAESEPEKKSEIHAWSCSFCSEIREKNVEPPEYSGECDRRGKRSDIYSHQWYDLGTVGDHTYYCWHCKTQIRLTKEPNMVRDGCVPGRNHSWKEIDY